jgi:hypothetical protein
MKNTGTQNINSISYKEYFFSPQLNKTDEIDIEHQALVESIFIDSFKEVYQVDYDKNAIQFDDNLNKLIKCFYAKIYNDPMAHKNCINGTVSYSVLQQNVATEIMRIPFELSTDYPISLL